MLNEKNAIEVLGYLHDNNLTFEEYLILLVNSKGNKIVDSTLHQMLFEFHHKREGLIEKGYLDKRHVRTQLAYKIPHLKLPSRDFEAFWKAYPSSDKWGSWTKTRVLRSNKAKSRTLYNKAVREVGHDNLMMALKAEVDLKRKNSSVRNEMRFMPAITAWLSKSAYEAILEDLGDQEQNTVTKGTRYEGKID
jgi:hypothetical protein